ncbi:uncharacterized protein Tco025E_06243 [Trypanosoma conorhini]|uniref:4a-hydroxytetrahydrobiopterin dehydratase n=1 Tax=Trypanosoma conorhini TaxID=83891 RepID=A0A3R7P5Y0_9TRYP|nr:uncharacterized protein Tco025E_06243 [Trypanosoma conorhini]RNF13275.1 hypothetical protein Tco025E_06243 [Trypanosoma conorhini]
MSPAALARVAAAAWRAGAWPRRVSSGCGAAVLGGSPTVALTTSSRRKGDYGFNVFHNSNPQHGGSYARHERRMREDEVEDFMRSVRGWVPADDAAAAEAEAEGPSPLTIFTGAEAIKREFVFPAYRDAYLFMGRFWAFCYGSDKYPHVTWDGTRVTVYLYSPSFRGLSKREARLAAFLNDQYNMFKKSRRQQEQLVGVTVRQTRAEELMGDAVAAQLRRREEERRRPLAEVADGRAATWDALLDSGGDGGGGAKTP